MMKEYWKGNPGAGLRAWRLTLKPARRVQRIGQRASGLFTDLNETARSVRFFPGAGPSDARRSTWQRVGGDLCGGTVSALMSLPYGMALSLAIGLDAQAGIYTSIIGGVICGLFSKSPVMLSGLSATAVPVLALVVKAHGVGGALAVGVLSGLLMVLVGALRLGRFANYLPPSIISAFTCGLGLVICTTQLKAVFGVKPVAMNFDVGIVDDLAGVALALPGSDAHALLIAGAVAATMWLLPRWRENVPSSLIGVVLAALLARLLGFPADQTVGDLPSGFPALRAIELNWAAVPSLLHPAATLAGLFTINQVLTAIVVSRADKRGGALDSNRELISQGVANVCLPFFGSPPGVAMLARSVASARAGAATRLSLFFHSGVLLLFIIPLRGLVEQIPLAALAAVTVMVGLQLIDWKRLRSLRSMSSTDLALFLLTFALVVLSDLIVGVGLGFLVAMLLFIERSASSTYLEEVPAFDPAAGEVVSHAAEKHYRLIGPLFFASSEKIYRQLEREVSSERLTLDLGSAGLVDSAAIDFLRNVYRLQKNRGGDLYLVNLGRQHLFIFEKGGLLNELGAHRFSLSERDAPPVSDFRQSALRV